MIKQKDHLEIDGLGSYKLYFVPYGEITEGNLLRFIDGVMNNTKGEKNG